ncbi:MAG: GGDEF domain-containing protein [Thermodesulfobacteriota bacterium]
MPELDSDLDQQQLGRAQKVLELALPKDKPKQKLRLQRFFMALASYIIFLGLTLFCYWQGYFLASWWVMLLFVVLILVLNLGLYLLFILELNLGFRDASLTLPQMLVAILVFMASLYFYTEEVRGALLILCYVIFMFGVLRLKVRQFVQLTVLVLVLYGLIIALLAYFEPQRVDFQLSLLYLVITALGLFWFSLMGGYISQLRSRLANTNDQLHAALEKIEELASVDHLTGVYNRRKMMQALEYEKRLADRMLGTFSILLLDLDHFKEVNDLYGHLAGDSVLQTFVQEISASLREVDLLARYGGEEFLVLLPRTELQQALQCAERLRQKTMHITFPGMPKGFSLQISIGVAEYHLVESLESTLHRMDQALYLAKERGRNRVEVLQRYTQSSGPRQGPEEQA